MSQTIVIGEGLFEIGAAWKADGTVVIGLKRHDQPRPIGTPGTPGRYVPKDSDIVIELKNIEGARVFQDAVNHAVLLLNGLLPKEMKGVQS